MNRRLVGGLVAAAVLGGLTAPAPSRAAPLASSNNTPFPSSTEITGATWTSARYGPPDDQWGDILATSWADDDDLYVLMDDGGTDTASQGTLWRNSFAQISGTPPNIRLQPLANASKSASWTQIAANSALWTGPLGTHYSMGFAEVNNVFYATQANNWNWNANGPFDGLAGIGYSTDDGKQWHFPDKQFPGPTGNLNWVQTGRGTPAPDGYVYAISTEREFNASTLLLGRTRPKIADMTNPARWQWVAGWRQTSAGLSPVWSSSVSQAQPIIDWQNHITYPRMSYDAPLHRYLLTFTYSYGSTPPGVWQDGSELVILESEHPWGPFSFVARQSYFGPSNGYDPALPVKWISSGGSNLWMIYAANFDGCASGLNCTAAYGFNYQELHLTLGAQRKSAAGSSQTTGLPQRWRRLPAAPPKRNIPRLYYVPATSRERRAPPGSGTSSAED